jgi:hypothetical protein
MEQPKYDPAELRAAWDLIEKYSRACAPRGGGRGGYRSPKPPRGMGVQLQAAHDLLERAHKDGAI